MSFLSKALRVPDFPDDQSMGIALRILGQRANVSVCVCVCVSLFLLFLLVDITHVDDSMH